MIKGLSEDIRFLVLVTLILKRLDSLAFLNLFLTQGDTIITRPRHNPWVTLSLLLKFLLEPRSCAIRINECFFFFFFLLPPKFVLKCLLDLLSTLLS